MVPVYDNVMVFLPHNSSTENGRIPGCSFILGVATPVLLLRVLLHVTTPVQLAEAFVSSAQPLHRTLLWCTHKNGHIESTTMIVLS